MKYKLGELVELYDEINVKGEFQDLEYLQGINNLKYFQECKSNKNNIDLLRYRICRNGMFAYNRATSRNGEKISIAYRIGNDCLISPSYYCFFVKNKNILSPEYLNIWFQRPIFDKYARFNSWGSATEFFSFEDFCETEIELPDIKEQNKIVRNYNVINNRIKLLRKINQNLNKELDLKFKKIISDATNSTNLIYFKDEIIVVRGVSYKPEDVSKAKTCDNVCLLRANNIENFTFSFDEVVYLPLYYVKKEQYIKRNDILISMSSGSQSAVGKVAVAYEDTNCVFGAFCGKISFIGKHPGFITTYFKSSLFRSYLNEILLGTTINNIKQDDLTKIIVNISSENEVDKFEKEYCLYNSLLCLNNSEIQRLLKLENMMILNISKEMK